MEAREQRGLMIAATKKVRREGIRWIVPSQYSATHYSVFMAHGDAACTCPDYETRREKCKHIYAAIFVMQREENPDGSTTVTQAMAIAEAKKPTYSQQWPAYNAAQTSEKDEFQSLLFNLCQGVPEPIVKKTGRPTLLLSDALFSVTFKVYSTVSGRRFMSDLREAERRGYLTHAPHYNSVFNYLENAELTPILKNLIVESSLPLKAVEVDFAMDSSGFTTSRFKRWYDVKYGKEHIEHDWVKCHLMCGVKTNIITAVEIGGRNASDVRFLPPLVETTARNFQMSEVSADKGYTGRPCTDAITRVGATPFIAFKGNSTGGVGGSFEKMFHYFQFRKEEFLEHYHKRSNIETAFSMMKRKFGDGLRSKTDVAMVNEALCKILCHNLVVLIHEMHELGIDVRFSSSISE